MGIENSLIQAIAKEGTLGTAEEKISTDMFHSEREKEVYEQVLIHHRDFGKVPDLETLKLKWGFEPDPATPLEPVEFWIKELYNRERYNKIASAQVDIVEALRKRNPAKAAELMQETVDIVSKIGPEIGSVTWREAYNADAVKERVEQYDRVKSVVGIDGIPSPWPTLDGATFGWHEKDFVLVVARSGVGKTWAILHMAKAAWEAKKKVLFVTFEMAENTIGRRLDSLVAKVPYHQLRAGELGVFVEAMYKKKLEEAPKEGFTILSGGWAATPAQLEIVIKKLNPDIVFIDGLYLMQDGLKTREPWQRVQNVADQIKQMAMRVDIPVVGTVQFNRNVNIKKLKAGLESVGGADRLVQNADIVVGLFRNDKLVAEKELVLRLLKVREDEMVSVLLNWDFDKCDFSEKGRYEDPTKPTKAKHDPTKAKKAGIVDEPEPDY